MELRVLRYFLAVAREESISGAAEYLSLSQPTLSRQLMELEEELGKKLFVRGNRRITLTEEGELLRRRAGEIVALAEKTKQELRDTRDSISGDLHIGGGETEAMGHIARAARKLQQLHPGIRYHLYSGNADEVTEQLNQGLLDFGVMVEPFDRRKYECIKLPDTDVWGVLLRRDHPLAQKKTLRPEDLWDVPLLVSRQSMAMEDLPGWLGKPMEELSIAGTYNLLYNASLMVKAGVGCALCLDKLVAEGEELCFRLLEPRQEVGVWLVWKKYQVFSRAAGKFLELLRQEQFSAGDKNQAAD